MLRASHNARHEDGRVRRSGAFLYEAFVATDGSDIKAYTLGERYCRAERRAAPMLDGVVVRDPVTKKQQRTPLELTG